MARVVVVGGGLAGTAAAVRLAKAGHEVIVIEQHDRVGGAVGFVEDGGFRWPSGPTSTALPAALRDLFRKSGRALDRELELVPVQPMREHRFTDGSTVSLPSGSRAAQIAAVDAALGAGLGRRWADYVHAFAEPWDVLRRDYLERGYSPGHVSEQTERLLRSRVSLSRAVRRLEDHRLETMALHHARQAGHEPRRVPAWVGMVDYVEQSFGTWTVPGGFGALADALAKRLRERGVEVLLGTRALDVAMTRAGPRAVVTDAGEVGADAVVVAIDPRRLPVLAALVDRTTPAPPPTVTHLGLVGDLPALPPEVVLHGRTTVVVRTDGQAPAGAAAWTLLTRGRLSGDRLIGLASSRLQLSAQVEVRIERSPRQLVQHYAGSPYGVLWRGRGTVRHRLGPMTPLRGVYAAGAHVAPLGLVPFVTLTAAVVAEAVGRA